MHQDKTKVFFFGTPHIAVPSLEALAQDEKIEIVGVGVFPDRKVGRKQVLTPCAVKQAALDLDLPVFEIKDKAELAQVFETHDFDLGLVIAFGMIFPEAILSIPVLGVVNVHFSLLPQYRGASPVQSSILNGDEVSGITFQQMVKALDAGDILFQESYPIKDMGTTECFDVFARLTANILPKFIQDLETQKITPIPQNEDDATFCGKFQKSDGEVFPKEETATAIYQKYLAFDLWPGVFCMTDLGPVKLKKISKPENDKAFRLRCAQDTELFLETIQIPGKKPQPVKDALNGHPELFNQYQS